MAGTIIVDKIQLDVGQDTLRVFSNTGSTILSANTSGINAASLGYGTLPSGRLPTGAVLQAVQATYTTLNTIVSSTSYGNVFSVSISPTTSSSKILILGSVCACPSVRSGSRSSIFSRLALFRNGTAGTKLYETMIGSDITTAIGATFYGTQSQNSICYLDSPSTTSATTYNIAIASRSDTTDLCTLINNNNADNPGSSPSSYIVALEIAG